MAEVVVLWGIFLVTQLLKARHPNCTWQYFAIFAAQVAFLLAVTAYSVWCALPAPHAAKSWRAQAPPLPPQPLGLALLEYLPSGPNTTSVPWHFGNRFFLFLLPPPRRRLRQRARAS